MRIWMYSDKTGELLPSKDSDYGYDAVESPREQGQFIKVKNSTTLEPPEFDVNEIPVYANDEWIVLSDFRKLDAWDVRNGNKIHINEIGVEPEVEYTEDAPGCFQNPIYDNGSWREKTEKEIFSELYDSNKEEVVATLRSMTESLLAQKYYQKKIPFKNKHIRADQKSQQIITGYMAEIATGSRDYPLNWITCENDVVTIDDSAELVSVVKQMSEWIESAIFACRTTKSNIEHATTFDDMWEVFEEYRDSEI